MSFFDITHNEAHTRARTGIIHTDHGDIETPIFMPVGTQATVKSLDPRDIAEIGAQIILANTYHLHLRPGEDLVAEFGGLHHFMQWDKPILTDSGGFQVFSLGLQKEQKTQNKKPTDDNGTIEPSDNSNNQAKLVSIDEDGVTFKSYIDGSTHRFTPESAIEIEHKLGADIIMAFDECTPDSAPLAYAREAMERTHRWAARSLRQHESMKTREHKNNSHRRFLFGIVQGGRHQALREESARAISALDFDGIAIGGESVGYNMEATKEILDWVYPIIPEHKPHYAMGLGFAPSDLFDVVERGVDMFDCVAPTRMARNGTLYIGPASGGNASNKYRLSITNAQFRADQGPIDSACDCSTCTRFTRSYLHHLFAANELLAYKLATVHNLHFFLSLMRDMRQAIREDRFLDLKKQWMQ